jgi:hypothetical protein
MLRQAAKLEDEDDIEAAERMLARAEDVAEHYEMNEQLARAKYNRALLMASKLGRHRQALPIAERAVELAGRIGRGDLQQNAKQLVRAIRNDLGA